MKVRTRWSLRTASRVGPWSFASCGVLVLVSARWTFALMSAALPGLSAPGRGAEAASVMRRTLAGSAARVGHSRGLVSALEPLRDGLHPAQLGESRAAHDQPAREREPRLQGAAQEADPRRRGRIHLRTLSSCL